MAVVIIDGNDFIAYASLAAAEEYEKAVFGPVGDAWRAETDTDVKGRTLVTSSNLLDRLVWNSGYESDPLWQQAIVSANIEYAAALLEGSFLQAQTQNASGIKILKAGSAMLEYFKNFSKASPATTLPPDVFALLKPWLGGSGTGGFGAPYASGTQRCSDFLVGYGVNYGF